MPAGNRIVLVQVQTERNVSQDPKPRRDEVGRPGNPADTAQSKSDDREARLAEALRANLRRRKAAARTEKPEPE